MADIDCKRSPALLHHKTVHLSLPRMFIQKCLKQPYLSRHDIARIQRYSAAIESEGNKLAHMRSVVERILVKIEPK